MKGITVKDKKKALLIDICWENYLDKQEELVTAVTKEL